MTQYCLLLAPPNQTSQDVTHPGIALAEARLTAEFWWVHGHHGFKTRCVIKGAFIHISTSPFPGDVGRYNHLLLGPSVPAGDPHGITPFLASQGVPADNPHGLVYTPTISGWAIALIPFVTTHPQWHNIICFWLPRTRLPRRSPILRLLNCGVLMGSWPSRL